MDPNFAPDAAPAPKVRQVQLVGRKIRQLRKERKLTQVDLAARLGIQQSDLSRMEQGEYRVSLDTLLRILAEFKMSIGEFFEEGAERSITPRDMRLVQDFKALPDAARREVEEFISFKHSQGQPDDARDAYDGDGEVGRVAVRRPQVRPAGPGGHGR
jgi:transcriptional regulator with XRE-family HTH domain